MKVLVIGGGGREHALTWKIAQSPLVAQVYCAPGNAGIAAEAACVPIPAGDVRALAEFCRREKIDLTVVGPEMPLTLGIVDYFGREGLRIVGPSQKAAEIEGSKVFAKELMHRCRIPTGFSRTFSDRREAERYVAEVGLPVVVKADGLAAGKGVVICRTPADAAEALEEMLERRIFGSAGDRVVVEEFLEGEEASCLAFTDGTHVLPLPSAQDHKTVYDGDQGPNTGGMGAYSPAPVVSPAIARRVIDEVMLPAVRGMAAEGRTYRGILYAGLMITPQGLRVLEFNARLGDPETQPLLMRMESDLVPVLEACANGEGLDRVSVRWRSEAAVCVVMASGGYPRSHETGKVIRGVERADALPGVKVFHGGTAREGRHLVTSGGRVLGVTALGATVREAVDRAYEGAALIDFEGAHYRRDIAHRAMGRPTGV